MAKLPLLEVKISETCVSIQTEILANWLNLKRSEQLIHHSGVLRMAERNSKNGFSRVPPKENKWNENKLFF